MDWRNPDPQHLKRMVGELQAGSSSFALDGSGKGNGLQVGDNL
jgi:hypothetical protein